MYQTSPELRKLQLKCLEILREVDQICRTNGIEYSLCGGSVVGAYLYHGFIPWDDDIDLMMTRKNYERFLKVCSWALPNKYELQNYKSTSDYKTLFSKVVDTSTTLIQYDNKNREVVNGVFLDITVYDKVPKGKLKQVDFALSRVAQKLLYCDINQKENVKKKILALIGNHCSSIYVIFEMVFRFLGCCKEYNYCELYGAFCTSKEYDKNIFEKYEDIKFEDKKYMIVKDYLQYLVCRYDRTDFYEPEERQIPPHYSYINLEMSYRDYLKGKHNEN